MPAGAQTLCSRSPVGKLLCFRCFFLAWHVHLGCLTFDAICPFAIFVQATILQVFAIFLASSLRWGRTFSLRFVAVFSRNVGAS